MTNYILLLNISQSIYEKRPLFQIVTAYQVRYNFYEFISHLTVKSSIDAKHNAIVYDFMLDNHKKENEICMIVDFTAEGADSKEISGFFCEQINNSDVGNLKFSFYKDSANCRVILKGCAEVVLKIMNDYYNL